MITEKGPLYYIVVYDAEVKRVSKVLKILRKYMHWVQNSVFEGELTQSQLLKLKHELNKVIDPNHDSIIIYGLREKYLNRETIGKEKGNTSMII